MHTIWLVFISLLLVSSSSRHVHTSPAYYPGFRYTFQSFVLTWPGKFCSTKSCNPFWMSMWNGSSFTVHGLWPNSEEPGFIQMMSQSSEDPDCTAPYKFNLGLLPQQLLNQLHKVMPDLTSRDFLAYEWNKHGVCYLKLLNDNAKGFNSPIPPTFARTVFIKYFQSIADLYNRITSRFRITKGYYSDGYELAADLGLDPRTVKFSVSRGQLKEISICVTLPRRVNEMEQIQPCPFRTQHRQSIQLPGWRPAGAGLPSFGFHDDNDSQTQE